MINSLKNILKRLKKKRLNKRMAKVYKDLAKISRKNNIVIITEHQVARERTASERSARPQFAKLEPGQHHIRLTYGGGGFARGSIHNITGTPNRTDYFTRMTHFRHRNSTRNPFHIDEEQIYRDEEQEVTSKDNPSQKIEPEPEPEPIISRKVNTAVLELEI